MPKGRRFSVKSLLLELVKKRTKAQDKNASLRAFIAELVVFTGLVVAYSFGVLAFLAGWLRTLFEQNKPVYAVVALGLIVAQGVILDIVSALLLKLAESRIE